MNFADLLLKQTTPLKRDIPKRNLLNEARMREAEERYRAVLKGVMSTPAIAEALGCKQASNVHKMLWALTERGLVRYVGKRPNPTGYKPFNMWEWIGK